MNRQLKLLQEFAAARLSTSTSSSSSTSSTIVTSTVRDMPAASVNLNSVSSRLPVLPHLERLVPTDFSMLPFQMAYSTSAVPQQPAPPLPPPHDLFLFSENNGFVDHHHHHHHHAHHHHHQLAPKDEKQQQLLLGRSVVPRLRSESPCSKDVAAHQPQFSPVSDHDGSPDGMAVVVPSPPSPMSSGGVEGHHTRDKMEREVMLVSMPQFLSSGRTEAKPQSTKTHHHHQPHHHQVLRYSSGAGGGDALLSATAIGYSDPEILQDDDDDDDGGDATSGGFDGLDDGMLSTGSGSGGVSAPAPPTTFELFDGDAGHDTYMGDENQSLQLSPHAFVLNDGSNLSDDADGNGMADVNGGGTAARLDVPPPLSLIERSKVATAKHPRSASSPSRTASQVCPVCSKVFSNSSALAKHKLTHSDERKYVCQLCTKAFKRQDHLNGHLLTHMNKKPYACKVDGCGKSYCDARSLRRHTENHHTSNSVVAVAAAAAAAANAIALRVGQGALNLGGGGSGSTGATPAATLPFGSGALLQQSNRICYAPPPPAPASSTSSLLQSVLTSNPLPSFACSTSPSSTTTTNAAATSATNSATSSSNSLATGQLQMLAFQQQPLQQEQSRTSLLSWQLQQPRVNSVYANSDLVGGLIQSQQQQTCDEPKQSAIVATSTSVSSVLAQHLRMSGLHAALATEQVQKTLVAANHLSSSMHQQQLKVVPPPPPTTQPLPLDLCQLRDEWMQQHLMPSAAFAAIGAACEVKQVECSICKRKFKNTPALNGHMRLHGGYFKKEHLEGHHHSHYHHHHKKGADRKWDGSTHHSPLQTASMNIRALIEEKIIQRRIVNPPVSALATSSVLPAAALPLHHHLADVATLPPPPQSMECDRRLMMPFAVDGCMTRSVLPPTVHHHLESMREEPGSHEYVHHQEDNDDEEAAVVLSLSPHDSDTAAAMDVRDDLDEELEDDDGAAQSDMQRQIEIIKQGLMGQQQQHVSEKFRRHSDSDHFLAPRRLPYDDDDVDGCFSVGALADFFQRKMTAKRMQRTGSDPGEFVAAADVFLPDDVVAAAAGMDVFESEALDGDDDPSKADDIDDLSGGFQVNMDALPSSDIMDFEENLATTLSLHSLARTPPLPAVVVAPVPPPPPVTMSMDDVVSYVPRDSLEMLPPPPPPPAARRDTQMQLQQQQLEEAPASFSGGQQHTTTTTLSTKLAPPSKDDDDDVFVSPTSIPTSPIRGKKKHRPEPLFIPPQVNTCGFQSRLRSPRLWDPGTAGAGGGVSPPPYTPPPMLSPVRCGPGLFWHVRSASGSMTPKSAPLTPGRQMAASFTSGGGAFPTDAQSMDIPEDEEEDDDDEEAPETDILPHVNVGSQFQARLPVCRPFDAAYDPDVDDRLWTPIPEDATAETDKDVETYLQFACCAAVPGGGRNKEYALHVLQLTSGDIQEAMLLLMDPSPKLERIQPLVGNTYTENDRWSAEDIESYQQLLMTYDKDFFNIALELKSKSVKECVQFYYLWKKVCPEEYKKLRLVRRRREQEGLLYQTKVDGEADTPKSDDMTATSSPQGGGIDCYVCDYPDCFARFVSRQALNGHVRIHNNHRHRSRSPLNEDVAAAARYSPANVAPFVVEEFPCKICGKVFPKVKSRSAHMKSHRPVDPSRNK